MALVELSLKSLEELDAGRVAKAFAHELRRAVQDCLDRPRDKKARTVTLELNLTPCVTDEGGIIEATGADGEFSIKSKVPTRKSKTYNFRANKKGHLTYSSESPDNADQTTIFDVDQATGKIDRGTSPK